MAEGEMAEGEVSGLKWLQFMISLSTPAMKMLAKATAIFVPNPVPYHVFEDNFCVKMERDIF